MPSVEFLLDIIFYTIIWLHFWTSLRFFSILLSRISSNWRTCQIFLNRVIALPRIVSYFARMVVKSNHCTEQSELQLKPCETQLLQPILWDLVLFTPDCVLSWQQNENNKTHKSLFIFFIFATCHMKQFHLSGSAHLSNMQLSENVNTLPYQHYLWHLEQVWRSLKHSHLLEHRLKGQGGTV